LAGLPIIMITGRGDPAIRTRAKHLGVRAFLDKPDRTAAAGQYPAGLRAGLNPRYPTAAASA
jgi:CheY-like chemotaxis protein